MQHFLQAHKWKLIVITMIVLFCAIYLYAALQPGIWHQSVFLYQQEDGSFRGTSNDLEYAMQMKAQDGYAEITFSLNDITHRYEVFYDRTNVTILQDGESIFQGTYKKYGGTYLMSSLDEPYIGIDVSSSVEAPTFPSRGWLFSTALDPDIATRGKPSMLFLSLFLGLILFLDLRFPNLFFHLKYWWHVEGGEPTTWFRACQMVARFLLIIGILVCLIKGFA